MQLQNVVIRPASFADLQVLKAMADAMKLIKETNYFDLSYELQLEGKRILLIASLDRQDAGYCVLNWQPKYAFFRKSGIPEIQDLNVLPQFRRRGLARFIIRYCENLAREKDHEWMGIGVGLYASYGPAQKLYIKEGYVPDGNGISYDRHLVAAGEIRPVDDNLCLMMVKTLE